ncbi:3151_t:CDS:2, partial [Dentiscutata erythropus]
QCDYNTPCKCPTGWLAQGEYCGGQIGQGKLVNNEFKLYLRPTGNTCDYGYQISCAQCGALQCTSPVVSASSSQIEIPFQPTSMTRPGPTTTKPSTNNSTSSQTRLFIEIVSSIGGIILT